VWQVTVSFRLTLQVTPDPHFKPCDIKELNYPVDPRISELPIYDSVLQVLKPIKKAYEHSLSWDMRRYRVLEPEIPSGVAIKNKRRTRARDQNLHVSTSTIRLTIRNPSVMPTIST
jgi:RNA-dependent RNA polymerase